MESARTSVNMCKLLIDHGAEAELAMQVTLYQSIEVISLIIKDKINTIMIFYCNVIALLECWRCQWRYSFTCGLFLW